MKKSMALLATLLTTSMLTAQETQGIMQSSGKFYVVIAVVLAMFIGILIFLFILEKKLSNLERQIQD